MRHLPNDVSIDGTTYMFTWDEENGYLVSHYPTGPIPYYGPEDTISDGHSELNEVIEFFRGYMKAKGYHVWCIAEDDDRVSLNIRKRA